MQGPGLGKSRSAAHILLPAFFHSLVLSTTKLEEPVTPIRNFAIFSYPLFGPRWTNSKSVWPHRVQANLLPPASKYFINLVFR